MKLLSPFRLGTLELENRVVMAPMTRSRAVGGVPNDLMRDYYSRRSSAGLLITEGIAPSPNAMGYARIPGLFSDEQVQGFREITEGVHAAGGHIFAQLMHVGRIAHPLNLPPGARVVAPSAVRAEGTMWTDQQGPQPFPEPEALDPEGLREARDEFVNAARRAIQAGFDGVELHAANGYLLGQFIHPHTNRQSDGYGGSLEARARFVLEVVDATQSAIGADRLGIRFSPHGTFNDLPELSDASEVEQQYRLLARGLTGLAYVHIVNHPHPSFATTLAAVRQEFGGPMIRNGGFDAESAERVLASGQAELISFGRPFIANPDLVPRLAQGAAPSVPVLRAIADWRAMRSAHQLVEESKRPRTSTPPCVPCAPAESPRTDRHGGARSTCLRRGSLSTLRRRKLIVDDYGPRR